MKKVLFTATVDSHILAFHVPFLKLFKEKGYEVHVATNGDEKIPYCDVKHIVCFERSPFRINNLKAIKQLKNICDREQFDIIHCHTPMGSVVTRLAARNARKKGTRVIYTAHGFHFYKGAPLKNWMIYYPVEKFLAKFTDTIITINKEDFLLAKNKFCRKCSDIQYVPGVGIDEKKFNIVLDYNEKLNIRKSLGLNENDFVLIYVGRLDNNKNQGFLIDVMKRIVDDYPNIHLLLVGPDELNGKYQIQADGIINNIHFLGFRNDIAQLLKISDAYISSSLREGLPINILEAMISGLPIIASDCRGNSELISNEKNGLVFKKNNLIECIECINNIYNGNIDASYKDKNKEIVSNYLLSSVLKKMDSIYIKPYKILIIPTCTDLNRGDQALVLETKRIIDDSFPNSECYMMSSGETVQCQKYGVKAFSDILKHPSRFSKNNNNVRYSVGLKIRWGFISFFDFIISFLLLYSFTRKIIYFFLKNNTKESLKLYLDSKYVFVKGGGFLHDYSKGLIGLYTIYYQIYHILLALRMNKKVFIMPNSYGPFYNKVSSNIVKRVLKKCEIVTARESISASKEKNDLGMDIDLYPDLAFFLDEQKSTLDLQNFFKNNGIDLSRDNIIGITVRPYRFYSYDNPDEKYYNYKKSFVDFIKYLSLKDYKILLIVHTRAENDHENDEKCIDEIMNMLEDCSNVMKIKDDSMSCFDLKKIYGLCKYVIGTRFHSVIFSLEQNVPCTAITYGGNKGDGIMKDIGLSDYAIKIGELNSSNLISTFELMIKNRIKIQRRISFYLNEAQTKRQELLMILKNKA